MPSPGGVVAGFGSIWVQSGPRGSLLRVDPATGKVIARIPGVSRNPALLYAGVGGGGIQTLAAGEGAIWTLVNDGLLKIDPATNRPVAKIAVPRFSESVAVGERAVWVVCCSPAPHAGDPAIYKIDPATDRILSRSPLDATPASVAAGAGAVWVVDISENGRVSRINPATSKIVKDILGVPLGAEVSVGAGAVWVISRSGGGVLEISPGTNRILRKVGVPGALMGITTGGGKVWINSGPLVEVDPATGQATIKGHIGKPMDANAGIAYLDGRIWASDPSGQQLVTVRVQ